MGTTATDARAEMPHAVRRLLWWMALPFFAIVGGAAVFALPAVRAAMATPSLWWSIAIPFVFVVPHMVAVVAIARGQRRIKRAVLAANGRACTHCVHDLSGLGDAGICPECGRGFDTAADQKRWARVKMQH